MTRHARNCTAGAVYTYNEKKRDAAESGYGTNAQRLGKESVKSFDCCSLSLQPCRNPVITKDGYLFDKESILQYIITKKTEYARKLKEYEKQKRSEDSVISEKMSLQQKECIDKFVNRNKPVEGASSSKGVFGSSTAPSSSAASEQSDDWSISNMANGNEKKLPAFWLPSECPNAGLAKAKKPESTIYCPVSGRVLKVKDLIDVKFTLLKDDSDVGAGGSKPKSLIAKEARYMCPVTHDVLSNAVPCAVLKPTGDVVTMECVEKLIKKDMIHPLTNQKLSEKDIIPMQRGGTGFSTTNGHLEVKEKRPMLQC